MGLRDDLVVLLPDALRAQHLEVLCQPCAVEAAMTQIGGAMRRPDAAHQTPRQTHRIHVGLARRVGKGRAIQYGKPGFAVAVRQRQRDCPASPTVAVDDRSTLAMPFRNDLDESGERLDDRPHGLALDGLGVEDDEVDRVPLQQGHADLGVAPEASDARAVPGAWVDDDHRCGAAADVPLEVVGAASGDPEQAVVARRYEVSSVRDGLGIEVEQGWHARCLVVEHFVAALTQHIQGSERSPPCVGPISRP